MTARPARTGWWRAVSALAVVGALLSAVFLREYAAWVLRRPAAAVRTSDLVVIGSTVAVRAAIAVGSWRSLARADDLLARYGPRGGRVVALTAVVTVAGYAALTLAHPPVWLAAVRAAQSGCGVVGLVGLVAGGRNSPATRRH